MTVDAAPGAAPLALAAASEDDFEALLALRMTALFESLQRLGRFDPQRLYIAPQAQRQGVGSWVMTQVIDEADRLALPVRVTALKLSEANAFSLHHAFELQHESEWDLHCLRPALGLAHG